MYLSILLVKNYFIRISQQSDRVELLVKIIKEELVKDYESFIVKIIQIYYNDNYDIYEKVKIEDITKVVCI